MKICAVVAIVLIAAVAGCALNTSKVYKETHAKALRIEIGEGVCSGTAMGPHLVLSATHCFQNAGQMKINGTAARVLKRVDDGNDHTFLVVDQDYKTWASFGLSPTQGDQVHIWGNPGGLADQFRLGYIAGYADSYSKRAMVVQIPGFFGDSGSGLFNNRGEVVGVTSVLIPAEYEGIVFYLMGYFPIAFTKAQLAQVGYVDSR